MYNGISQRPTPLRLNNRFERQVNFLSDVVNGLQKRPNTEYVSTLASNATANAYTHTIHRALGEQYKIVFTGDPNSPLEVFDGEGNSYGVSFDNADTKDYITSSDPKKFNRCLTLKDEIVVLNTQEEVKGKNDYGSIDPNTMDVYAFAWIREGLPEIDYTLKVFDKDGNEIDSTTVTAPTSDNSQVQTAPTDDVAQEIVNNISPNLGDDYEIFSQSSVIYFKYTGSTSKPNADIKVETSDSYGDQAFIAINGKVDNRQQLPPNGIARYPIAVTGGRAKDEGAYYVEWKEDEEVYVETRPFFDFDGDQLPNLVDPKTMPRVIEQQDDGSFLVREADWKENLVGDEETSPMPSFVGSTINDVFFYRNRIGFLSDDNIVFTKAGEYFNLFPKTAGAVLDEDPIDVKAETRKNIDLRHGVAFAKSLICFAENVQFHVGSSGRALTPKTITIDPATYFETQPYCEPEGAGPHIYFTVPQGRYSGVREYFVKTNTLITDAEDVTSHVSKYVSGDIDKLVSAPAYNLIFALPENDQSEIYVYSYKWNQKQKIQSSWSKWEYEGENILDIAVNHSRLYIIAEQNGEVNLLKSDLRMVAEDNINIKLFLDRKFKTTGTYNADEDYTYFDLPYSDTSSDFTVVEADSGLSLNKVEKVDNTTLRALGDHSDISVYVGKTYKSLLEYSPFYISGKEQGLPDVKSSLYLKSLSLSFTNTGEFILRVTPYPKDDLNAYVEDDEEIQEYLSSDIIEQTHSGIVIGNSVIDTPAILTGDYTFHVGVNAKEAKIELIAKSYLPANFQITSYEAQYNNRSLT